MIVAGLWDAFNQYHISVTAENICSDYNLTRQELDDFALESQPRECNPVCCVKSRCQAVSFTFIKTIQAWSAATATWFNL